MLNTESHFESCRSHSSPTEFALPAFVYYVRNRIPPVLQQTMSFKGNAKVQKVMVQPINLIFRYLQNRSRVQVWLYENINLRIEGNLLFRALLFISATNPFTPPSQVTSWASTST